MLTLKEGAVARAMTVSPDFAGSSSPSHDDGRLRVVEDFDDIAEAKDRWN